MRNMIGTRKYNIIIYLLLIMLSSCATPERIAYFADVEKNKYEPIKQSYDLRVQKNDVLSISIESQSIEGLTPFEQNMNLNLNSLNETDKSKVTGYLVNSSGEINMSLLGSIYVEGLTYQQVSNYIENLIIEGDYLKDPKVAIRLLNFKITILGAVSAPGVKQLQSERTTIFDALGLANDMTIFGLREKVSVIREENGKRIIANIDISSKEVFNSPYYYMQPNDIVYVEPNKKQQKISYNNPYVVSYVFSSITLMISIIGIVLTITQ